MLHERSVSQISLFSVLLLTYLIDVELVVKCHRFLDTCFQDNLFDIDTSTCLGFLMEDIIAYILCC